MFYSGVDEVGYGALAGPILAVACTLPIDLPLKDLTDYWPLSSVRDSKKTTKKQRLALADELTDFLVERHAGVGVGIATADDINDTTYRQAHNKALLLAAQGATQDDGIFARVLIVDGNIAVEGYEGRQQLEAKADARFFLVAAASIIAKLLRDDMMADFAAIYPHYGFENHSGYGTAAHLEALEKWGLCPIHRAQPCTSALRKRGARAQVQRRGRVWRATKRRHTARGM